MIDIDIEHYSLIEGYYSLEYFRGKYPGIDWIVCLEEINNETLIANLELKINKSLENNKKVALVIWDEYIIFPVNEILTNFLNSYSDKPVWLITQLDPTCQLFYTFQHGFTCKIIELPWWWLNDVLVYYKVYKKYTSKTPDSYNYLCMIKRWSEHKLNLVKDLEKQQLDQYGLITFTNEIPQEFQNNKYIIVNPHNPYQNVSQTYKQTASKIGYTTNNGKKILISGNVENFLHIEKIYADIPLIIHSETSNGIFLNTEKSLWPLLLGKMMLIHGRPGIMKSVQRFYDFDISAYANLDFDDIDGYGNESHTLRLQKLLNDNRDLITNVKDVYQKFQANLETARYSIGKNLLDFCQRQISSMLN